MSIRISPAWHVACLAALAGVFLLLTAHIIYSGPYDYDEADYMFASQRGLWNQATDNPTMSLPDFVEAGRSARNGPRAALSESIRESDDVVFYRHWHGPLVADWLIALQPLGLDVVATRRAGFLFSLLAAGVIYWGAVSILPGWPGIASGFLAAALYLWSFATVRSSELAPHQMFALWCLAALFLLAKSIASGKRVHWYLAVIAAGLAFCTLEVALALIATLVIAAWFERRTLAADGRFALRSLAFFCATVALLWPAAIYKLSFVKAYAFMAYLALIRKNAWGDYTAAGVWHYRFTHFPVEWTLIAASLALAVAARRLPAIRCFYPLPLFAAIMILAVMRVNTIMPRYLLTFEPALLAFAGIVLASALWKRGWRPWPRALAIALLAGALCANTIVVNRANPVIPDSRGWDALAFIRDRQLTASHLLVPAADLPTVHFYFPQTELSSYTGAAPTPADLSAGAYAAVLFPGSPLRFEQTGR